MTLEDQLVENRIALQDVQAKMDALVQEFSYEVQASSEFMDLLDEACDLAERIEILELELDFLEEQAYDIAEDEGSTLD